MHFWQRNTPSSSTPPVIGAQIKLKMFSCRLRSHHLDNNQALSAAFKICVIKSKTHLINPTLYVLFSAFNRVGFQHWRHSLRRHTTGEENVFTDCLLKIHPFKWPYCAHFQLPDFSLLNLEICFAPSMTAEVFSSTSEAEVLDTYYLGAISTQGNLTLFDIIESWC